MNNINTQKSRVGITVFGDSVSTTLDIGYYDSLNITDKLNDIQWKTGWLNYPEMFDEVIAQFDSISMTKNTQQILLILTDDEPRLSLSEYITVCNYRNLLATKGIICFFLFFFI